MKHRARLKDVVQGRVLYKAYTFPCDRNGWVEEIHPVSRPYVSRFTGSLVFKTARVYDGMRYRAEDSCMDAGILPNSYNFHMTFTKKKAAEAYLDRIMRHDFTGEERIKYKNYIGVRRLTESLSHMCDYYGDYDHE